MSFPPEPRHLSRLFLILFTAGLLGGCGGEAKPPTQQEQELINYALQFEPQDAPRLVPLDGAHNFRDMGGYVSLNKKNHIKSGLFYRSDKLSELSATDQEKLEELGIRTVVDFRTEAERAEEPSRLPPGVEVKHFPIGGDIVQEIRARIRENTDEEGEAFNGREFMHQINREFVTKYTPVYSQWLHSLLEEDATPQVFHCTAGKDRTGFAAAVLMRILRMPLRLMRGDYLLSKVYGAEQEARQMGRMQLFARFRGIDPENIRPLLTVETEFLEAALDVIQKEYGNFGNYIRHGLNITPQERRQLIQKFTEPVPKEE